MPALDNPRHERWCQLVATPKRDGSVMTDTEAYQLAYGASLENAKTNAWTLRDNQGLQARIKELQAPLEVKRVLSMSEKREFLASVVRTPIGNVDETSPLAQSVKYSGDGGKEIKMPGKLEALKLDAQLAGELTDRGESLTMININLMGMELEGRSERPVIDVESQEG
jgi:hypothetical protein